MTNGAATILNRMRFAVGVRGTPAGRERLYCIYRLSMLDLVKMAALLKRYNWRKP